MTGYRRNHCGAATSDFHATRSVPSSCGTHLHSKVSPVPVYGTHCRSAKPEDLRTPGRPDQVGFIPSSGGASPTRRPPQCSNSNRKSHHCVPNDCSSGAESQQKGRQDLVATQRAASITGTAVGNCLRLRSISVTRCRPTSLSADSSRWR